MRVLILSALLACATAAPSFYEAPKFYAAVPALPVAIPTIPPGDLQAAAINAQVKAEDQARALTDQARELAEQAAENQNDGVAEANDLAKERTEQAFWNAEEQKWQALDALKTAEAQTDSLVANLDGARSAYYPYVASGAVVSGFPAGVPALLPGYQIPASPVAVAKAAESPAPTPNKVEAPAAEPAAEAPQAVEEEKAVVKSTEPEKSVEAEKSTDSVQVESADLKASAPEPATNENPLFIQSFAQSHPALYTAPFAVAPVAPALAYSQPWIAPVAYVQPGLKAVATSSIHQVHGPFVAPAVLKTHW